MEDQPHNMPPSNPHPASPGEKTRTPKAWLRLVLVLVLLLQILFMVVYWSIYTIYLIAGTVFAPGRAGELSTFGACLTAFVVISIGVTGYEIVVLLLSLFVTGSRGKRIGVTRTKVMWLSVCCVISGVWMVLPVLYLVWVMRNPYLEVFAGEVLGMGGACLVFLVTVVWNGVQLWNACFPRDMAVKDTEEGAPLLGGEDTDSVIEREVQSS